MAGDFFAGVTETANATDSVSQWWANCDVEEAGNSTEIVNATLDNPLTPTVFRLQFPAFANSQIYPDMQVEFYIGIADMMINHGRWGKFAKYGAALIAAHFLALARQAASNPRGIPGTVVGVLNSGSVDKVSYGRDIASIMEENAGHWGMTTFGLIYLRFARQFGMGPVQVGVPFGAGQFDSRNPLAYLGQSAIEFSGNAWPGPFVW